MIAAEEAAKMQNDRPWLAKAIAAQPVENSRAEKDVAPDAN
jgi:hypothetical protein